ncbi:unnamed protein product [Spirodela intermedia]|uniref:RRM domain-containing protein n=1 Tax=Spirodela intermedia TaxID=51605 RepID=A0A7I8K2Y8_SPIIN|nr:unnamed protein product [Spirodela intermedia]
MAASSSASFLLLLPSSSSTRVLLPNAAPRFPARAASSSAALPSLSLAASAKPLSVVSSTRSLGQALVPHVSASPRVDTEEEAFTGQREDDEPRFPAELKLFVGNLPFSVDSAQLAQTFSRAGTVEMVEVIYDKLTGKSRGFGFVTMSTVEEVEAAVDLFSGYEIQGRPLRVNSGPPPSRDGPPPRRFRNGSESDSTNRVYVGNLSWSVDDQGLQSFFSEVGSVVDARVVIDRETGRSKGFGFVTFSSTNEADSAISSFNGAELDGRAIRVTIAEARQRRQF